MIFTKTDNGIATIKSTLRINHPKANLLTINIGHDAHAHFPLSVELSFSMGQTFLTDVLPDFASWAVLDHDDRVMSYYYVPLATLAKFINIYAIKD
jgi:hypothetical protein